MITFAIILLGLKILDWLLIDVLEPWFAWKMLELQLQLKRRELSNERGS